MDIAFYAPLKPVSSPNPSGDRLIGRLLKQALELGGHRVDVASSFRSYEGKGDAKQQMRLQSEGQQEAARVLAHLRLQPPDLWFTYHLYRKAPDWIGPLVCRELNIPYVVAEASFAPSQDEGAWAHGHQAVADTLAQVDLAFGMTAADEICLLPQLSTKAHYVRLKPFLDTEPFARAADRRSDARSKTSVAYGVAPDKPWLLTVAMMRPGVKFESYQVLADALKRCQDTPWHLFVVGDGPDCDAVHSLFKELEDRITWLGALSSEAVTTYYAASDVYVWPSVRESPGMTFLEAQASGLPVIGGDGGGVPDVIKHGVGGFLTKKRDADDFSINLMALLKDPARRRAMGQAAVSYVDVNHSLNAATACLNEGLSLVRP